jgi:Ca2+-binding EF-hand superfamily protein
MRISTLLATAALATAMAGSAFAQPPAGGATPPTPEQQAAAFKAADKNGDGKLDAAEFKAMTMARMGDRAAQMTDDQMKMIFDRRDTDKDGFISAAENAAPMGRRGG